MSDRGGAVIRQNPTRNPIRDAMIRISMYVYGRLSPLAGQGSVRLPLTNSGKGLKDAVPSWVMAL